MKRNQEGICSSRKKVNPKIKLGTLNFYTFEQIPFCHDFIDFLTWSLKKSTGYVSGLISKDHFLAHLLTHTIDKKNSQIKFNYLTKPKKNIFKSTKNHMSTHFVSFNMQTFLLVITLAFIVSAEISFDTNTDSPKRNSSRDG